MPCEEEAKEGPVLKNEGHHQQRGTEGYKGNVLAVPTLLVRYKKDKDSTISSAMFFLYEAKTSTSHELLLFLFI